MAGDSVFWEVIQSDVLIIGGGFGALWAAVRAAECGSSVTVVDKSFAGKSGHSYFASGLMQMLFPDDNLDDYVYDIVLGNDWLIEQQMVASIFAESYQRLKDLESYGISFQKSGGKYVWTKSRGTRNIKLIKPENATAADEVIALRKVALSKGVRFVDHVYVYDLAKGSDDSIAGAIGIGVKQIVNYLFKAKSVIVATNTGSYRGHHLACELQGTGPFMAYDAGARLKNPEFHYINIRPAKHEIEGSGVLPVFGAKWINAKGTPFMEKYDSLLKDRASSTKIVVAAAKEAREGNAPIFSNVRAMTEEDREKFRIHMASYGWQPLLFEKCRREEGYDILRDNIEWNAAYESNKLGIDADINGGTTLKGLFAAGMARSLGINPFTGWSINSCTWSGYTTGESASKYAQSTDVKRIDLPYLSKSRETFLAPRLRDSGVDPDALVYELQKILFPADVLIIMSEPRLINALDKVTKVKAKLPDLKATDVRTLIKSKEVETMTLSAEMSLKAAIMRKETRENIFYREDYPIPDNKNWLKWIIVEKGEDGEIKFTTKEVPFDKFKPEKQA